MRSFYLAGFAAALLSSAALAQNATPPAGGGGGRGGAPATAGVIQSFDGTMLTIKTDKGDMVSAALAANASITSNEKVKFGDIKPNDFVATGGMLEADGKIYSTEVRIFPEANRGRGEGQFPMAGPNQVMTNATVKQVSAVSTGANGVGVMHMSFRGVMTDGKCTGRAPAEGQPSCTGETDVYVRPDVPVTAQKVMDKSALKVGEKASMAVTTGADGKPTTARVTLTTN